MIQRPMLNVSSTDDYVTVLSIPDSPTNSMYLNSANYNNIPPPLHSGDSTASTSTQPTVSSDSFDGRLKSHSMDFRSSPSSPYGRRVAAAQGVVKVMNFGADPDINHDEKPSKSSLIQPNSPSKPRRRIEFDESIRPKTHYGAISQSQSESSGLSALKRDKAHKSGFFYGLEPASEEEIEEVEGAKVQKIVLSKDTMGLRTGLSVTGVPQPDSPEKLVAIEVIDIEEGSRIAVDDQLRIEDRITKINGRPVYQMSLSRARIYLHELESQEEPSISFYRPAKPTDSERETPLQYKKISVPQQKGNTSQVHEKIQLTVVKSPTGFGFGIASRTSPTDNSNIFLVTTVVPDGPAEGILMPGDRIIKINGEELADKSQPEVVQIMRECAVNSELKFEISRNTENSDTESIGSAKVETKIEIQGLDDNLEILDLKIAVNEKVGAGLGLTIKAKQTRKANGEVVEGGVFVGRILHGSAAFKDGRLKKGDRILGIETVNLLCFKRNSDAVYAFNHTVSQMPASTLYFRLLIGREIEGNSEFPCRISREEFLEWAKEAEDSAKLRKLGLPISPTPSSTAGRSSSTNFSSQNQKPAISPPSTSHSNNMKGSEETLNKLRENKQGSMDEETASLTSVVPEDAFDRNAASRKSFSEKAPFGMKSPSDFESFKKIAHHRQISGNERQSHRSVSEGPSASTVPRLRSKSHHDRLEKSEDLKEKEKKRKSVFKFLQTKAEPQKSVDEISPRKVLLDQNEENLGQNSLPHHYHQRFASAQEHWMGNAPNQPSAFVRYQTERLSMDPHSSARADPLLHSKSAVLWPQPPQATGYRHSQRFWLVDPHAHYAYFTRHPIYESDLAESQRNPRPAPSAGDQPLDRNANCSGQDPHRALLTSENGPALAGRPGEEQGPRNGTQVQGRTDGRGGVLRKEEGTSDIHLQQHPGFARNGSSRLPTKPPGYAELYPDRVRAPQPDYYHQFNQYFSHANPAPAAASPLQKRGDKSRSTSMPREAARIAAPSPAATIQPLYEAARPVYYPANYHQQGSPSNFYQQYRSHQFHPHPTTLHSTRRPAPISYDAYVERF